jgi:hypothetical protein
MAKLNYQRVIIESSPSLFKQNMIHWIGLRLQDLFLPSNVGVSLPIFSKFISIHTFYGDYGELSCGDLRFLAML